MARFWLMAFPFSVALGVSAGGHPCAPAGELPTPANQVHDAIALEMPRRQIRAVAAAIIQQGRVVWSRGYGRADDSSSRVVTEDTPFPLREATRIATALAALRLGDRNQVGIDGLMIRRTAPDRRANPVFAVNASDILALRSGLAEEPARGHRLDRDRIRLDDIVSSATLGATPTGDSNAAWAMLGAALAEARGTDFEQVIADEVITPLGLKSAGFNRADRVVGHATTIFGRAVPLPKLVANAPALGLDMSVGDFARLLIAARSAEAGFLTADAVRALAPLVEGRGLYGRWINGTSVDWRISTSGTGVVVMTGDQDGSLLADRVFDAAFGPSADPQRYRRELIGDRLWAWPQGGGRVRFDPVDENSPWDRPPQDGTPPDCSPAWRGLIGEYGPAEQPVYVFEREGTLCLLHDGRWFRPLVPVGDRAFRFTRDGVTEVMFEPSDGSKAKVLKWAGMQLARRTLPGDGAPDFRIHPERPVGELLEQAKKAIPPGARGEVATPDLVDLETLGETLKFDIRYATKDNFLGEPVYPVAKAYLQRPAAEALVRVHRSLAPEGLGLLVHDAYRPWHITKVFWDATPQLHRGFVADPSVGSRHNRGCAVDLTLYDRSTGRAVIMPGGYDEFSDRAYPGYPGGTTRQRWYRDRLRRAMEAEGFAVFSAEWWHFDYRDWKKFPVLNEPLEKTRR